MMEERKACKEKTKNESRLMKDWISSLAEQKLIDFSFCPFSVDGLQNSFSGTKLEEGYENGVRLEDE